MTDRRFRRAVAVTLGLFVAGSVTAAVPATAGHGMSTLEVTVENERKPIGGVTTFVATITPPASNAPGAGNVQIDFEIVSGPNALRGGESDNLLTSPDASCSIFPGEMTCSPPGFYRDRGGSGRLTETDQIIAWIDHDGDNTTTEADTSEFYDAGKPDAEPGCPENTCSGNDYGSPGDVAEPDVTDVVLREWAQLQTSYFHDDTGLQMGEQFCSTDRIRVGGKVAATEEICSFMLAFPPERETHGNDFGAAWVQAAVDARRGYCTKRVATRVTPPAGVFYNELAATSPTSLSKRRVATSSLLVGASFDTTDRFSWIEQSFFAYPGKLTPDQQGGDKLVWTGSSRAALAFATGIAVGWTPGSAPGQQPVGDVTAKVVEQRRC